MLALREPVLVAERRVPGESDPERYTIPIPIRGLGLGTGIPAGAGDIEDIVVGSESLGLDLLVNDGVNVVLHVGVLGKEPGARSMLR